MATSPKPPTEFTPVPLRPRHDGWTAGRQLAFIEKLADCGSISAACKHVGMSRESVRKLRRSSCGRGFRDACDAALDCGYSDVEEAAMERSKNGVARPVFYKGEQVGEWRHYDEHLTMFLLRFRRRHRFGPEADSLPLPPAEIPGIDSDDERPFDPEGAFDGCFTALEFSLDPPEEEDGDEGQPPPVNPDRM